jgi:molybdenum cofactor synthesis domain-containing protein
VTTAALIVIGDEILNGRVHDVNAPELIDLMAEVGATLLRVAYIGDDLHAIAAEVRLCSELADVVVTSGGLGPTHDDRTVEGVARAFGVPVVRHPEIAAMIHHYWGDRVSDAALRMANVPQGSRLLVGGDELLPLVVVGNTYLLPGIPELFAAKLPSLRRELDGTPAAVRSIYLGCDESRVASILARVDDDYDDVKVGSYPTFQAADHRIWVTLEGTDPARVAEAQRRLLELLPDDTVVRSE